MDRSEARHRLGVGPEAGADEVRRAFRRLVLDHHPDRTGGDAAATRALVEAYRTLQEPEPSPDPDPDHGRNPLLDLVDGGSLELELPADEAFLAVLDAAAELGDVTYVDAEAGLLEVVLVDSDTGARSSLVLTLQGRAALGTTEVFGTLEPMG